MDFKARRRLVRMAWKSLYGIEDDSCTGRTSEKSFECQEGVLRAAHQAQPCDALGQHRDSARARSRSSRRSASAAWSLPRAKGRRVDI